MGRRRRKRQPAVGGGGAAPTTPTVWSALRQASEALDRGNRGEALELADQTSLRYATEPLAHLVRSAVYRRAKSCTGEFAEKLRLLQVSVDSTAQAAALSPSSINLLLLHASLMYNTVNFLCTASDRTYICREVAQVCARALSITDPTVFPHDHHHLLITPNATHLLNLTTDMELIRESLRTLRSDAEAIYRQPMPSSTPSFEHQLAECKDKSHKLYHVSIQDLEAAAHERSMDNGHHEAGFLLKEAIAFAEAERTFVLWVCCCCTQKFSSPDALVGHVMQRHVGILPPELQAALPQPAPSDWIQRSTDWHPLYADTLCRATSSKERAYLLEKIARMFNDLLDLGVLTASHVNEMVAIAMTGIHQLPYPTFSSLEYAKVGEWNACICASDTPRLKMIIDVLKYICEATIYRHNKGNLPRASQEPQVHEWRLILGKTDVILTLDANHEEALAHWVHNPSVDNDILPPDQAFKLRESERGVILQNFRVALARLQDMCKLKQKKLNCIRALQDCMPLGHEGLEKHKGELADATDVNGSFLRDALADILLDAQCSKATILEATARKILELSLECLRQDGLIMWTRRCIQHLEMRLIISSRFDYGKVVMPLMKMFLQSHMDKVVKENVQKKSMGAIEEEDEDGCIKTNGGANNVKLGTEVAEVKRKKKKDLRRTAEISGSARNGIAANEAKAQRTEVQIFWQGRLVLYVLLACLVFAYIMFHFNVHIF